MVIIINLYRLNSDEWKIFWYDIFVGFWDNYGVFGIVFLKIVVIFLSSCYVLDIVLGLWFYLIFRIFYEDGIIVLLFIL